MRPLGLTALAVGLLLAADSKDDAAKKDLALFQGKWVLISAQRDGKKTPEEEVKKITLTIQGNKYVLFKDGEVISEGTFTLDPTKRPKQIDETATAGPNKDKSFLAIYEIDDEHHKICFAAPGKGRPTAFSSEPGSGHLLQVWKREKRVELTGTLRTGVVAVGGGQGESGSSGGFLRALRRRPPAPRVRPPKEAPPREVQWLTTPEGRPPHSRRETLAKGDQQLRRPFNANLPPQQRPQQTTLFRQEAEPSLAVGGHTQVGHALMTVLHL